jgi:hypothetical protein
MWNWNKYYLITKFVTYFITASTWNWNEVLFNNEACYKQLRVPTCDLNAHLSMVYYWSGYKSKAVPLYAMVAHGGRGGIAPTHS